MSASKNASLAVKRLADLSLHLMDGQISPLYRLSYKTQLEHKQSLVNNVVKSVSQKLRTYGFPAKPENYGLVCPVSRIIPSPETANYRNKDEFSIWPGRDGKEKVVGFLSGSLRDPGTYCIPADKVILSKQKHKDLAKAFQEYIRCVSSYGICTHMDRPEGNWRRLIIRSNRKDQLMMIAVFHPKQLFPAEILEEKQKLASHFENISKDLGLHSLYFQACRKVRCNRLEAPFQLLFGEKFITESLNDISYRISPDSFFQINSGGAEILSNLLLDNLNLDKDTIVLDLYSGIGTFSLQVARKVRKVIAIEESFQAVQDANQNAHDNRINNCSFLEGKVGEKLDEVLAKLKNYRIVVIANPTRDGLSNNVITSLREAPNIDEIAFISCNPAGNASDNLVRLCRPFMPRFEVLGSNFLLNRTVPVDLFPHTNHCEVVFFLDRNKKESFM